MAKGREGGKAPLLVNIAARANAPERAVDLAETAAELVVQAHKPLFDDLMGQHRRYEEKLDKQVQVIQKELGELEGAIKSNRTSPQVNAPAVILMQAQLEQKQSQLLGFIRELRDVRIHNTSSAYSEGTRVVLPPVLPEHHTNPRVKLNTLIAGIIGFMSTLMLAFLLEYLKNVKIREETNKKA